MNDYYIRKARRVLRDSQHATILGKFPINESIVEVRKGYRSLGYRSGYQGVLKYWTIQWKDNQPVYGTTFTKSAWDKERAHIQKEFGIEIPA